MDGWMDGEQVAYFFFFFGPAAQLLARPARLSHAPWTALYPSLARPATLPPPVHPIAAAVQAPPRAWRPPMQTADCEFLMMGRSGGGGGGARRARILDASPLGSEQLGEALHLLMCDKQDAGRFPRARFRRPRRAHRRRESETRPPSHHRLSHPLTTATSPPQTAHPSSAPTCVTTCWRVAAVEKAAAPPRLHPPPRRSPSTRPSTSTRSTPRSRPTAAGRPWPAPPRPTRTCMRPGWWT